MERTSLPLTWGGIWAEFLALVALALALVSAGADWTHPGAVALLNVGCFVPLVWIAGAVAWRAHRLAGALVSTDGQWLRLHREQLDRLPERARKIREARIAALERPDARLLPAPCGMQGTLAALVDEARQRYVSGETVGLTTLRAFANDLNLERLDCFTALQQRALVVGFVGTLVDIIFLVLVAQRHGNVNLFAIDLLSGTLLAVTTTLQGVSIAAYAMWLRRLLLRRMDAQLDEGLRLLGVGLLPGLGDEDTRAASEIAEILGRATRDMEQRFVELSHNLGRAVGDALNGVSATMAAAIGDAMKKHLGHAITGAARTLEVAVTAAVADLQRSVQTSDQVLARAASTLERAADAIRAEVATAAHTPGELTRALQQSRHELGLVGDGFAQITAELRDAGAILRRSDDELIARAQAHETRSAQLCDQTERSRELLDQAATTFEETVGHLGRVVEKLVETHIARIDRDADPPPPASGGTPLVPTGLLERVRSHFSGFGNGRH